VTSLVPAEVAAVVWPRGDLDPEQRLVPSPFRELAGAGFATPAGADAVFLDSESRLRFARTARNCCSRSHVCRNFLYSLSRSCFNFATSASRVATSTVDATPSALSVRALFTGGGSSQLALGRASTVTLEQGEPEVAARFIAVSWCKSTVAAAGDTPVSLPATLPSEPRRLRENEHIYERNTAHAMSHCAEPRTNVRTFSEDPSPGQLLCAYPFNK